MRRSVNGEQIRSNSFFKPEKEIQDCSTRLFYTTTKNKELKWYRETKKYRLFFGKIYR